MTWFLIVVVVNSGGSVFKYHTPMPDHKTCIDTLKASPVKVPSGGDAENVVALTCGQKPLEFTR